MIKEEEEGVNIGSVVGSSVGADDLNENLIAPNGSKEITHDTARSSSN